MNKEIMINNINTKIILNIIFGFLLIIIISLLIFIGYIVFETEIYKDDENGKKDKKQ